MRAKVWIPRPSGEIVAWVRQEMLERGFTRVDTPSLPFDRLFLGWKETETAFPLTDKRWEKIPQFARCGCWLEELLHVALPEEALVLVAMEYRQEPAGYADKVVDRLHADGSYVRSVCTLYGPPTVYRDGKAEVTMPPKQTLLMTAMERARTLRVPCTLHRRPGAAPKRGVIVCSLEPRHERPRPKNEAFSNL